MRCGGSHSQNWHFSIFLVIFSINKNEFCENLLEIERLLRSYACSFQTNEFSFLLVPQIYVHNMHVEGT